MAVERSKTILSLINESVNPFFSLVRENSDILQVAHNRMQILSQPKKYTERRQTGVSLFLLVMFGCAAAEYQ